MSLRRFVPVPGGDAILDKVQALLQLILDALQADRLANDHLVVVTLGAGADTKVFHGLDQPIRTWDIVRQNADARVWEGAASTSPQNFFNLIASATVTVTVRCA